MALRLRYFLVLLLLGAATGVAGDRFAVLEFFGRTSCHNCNSAGPALITLQNEMQGRAALLEYDYDAFPVGRQDRFWASGASATYLPLVMVGSGYRTTSGPGDYELVFRSMINDELARTPRAEVTAYWRRAGSSMRAYVEVRNSGTDDLTLDEEASVWLIAYENATTGVSTTWARSTARKYLPFDLAPGESVSTVVDTPYISGAVWSRMAAVALVEDRPGGTGAYDMLQATEALPAGLAATPQLLVVGLHDPGSEVALTGPHVLSWAVSDTVPWIEVTPNSGTVPATVTLAVRPELRPSSERNADVTFAATGDGMDFSATVSVSVSSRVRRPGRRMRPLQ